MKNKLKDIRISQNLTQAELAEKTGVSRQTIIALESGKYIPTTLLALKLGFILKKNVEQVFFLEENDW